jgi:hypothetical protein
MFEPHGATRIQGFMAEYASPEEVLRAAQTVRDSRYTRWDTFTPFPVHGMDEAMGIKPTVLPRLVFAAGALGCVLALAMQWWMNAHDYPLVISGKPLWSIPANIPVTFEVTVLMAALTAVFGMLWLNGLPRLHHPVFSSSSFRRVTTDRFFLVIDSVDPVFDEIKTYRLLSSTDPLGIERVEESP